MREGGREKGKGGYRESIRKGGRLGEGREESGMGEE